MRPILPMLALLPVAFAGPALAQKSYDVDIVVFEHVDSRAAESERWRPEVVVPMISDTAAFEADGPRGERMRDLPEGFERLTTESGELSEAVERLESSSSYRVLRRSSWRQPALDADEAVALRFEAGEPMTVRIPAHAYPPPPEQRAQQADGSAEDGADDSRTSPSIRGGIGDRDDDRTFMPDTPFGSGMLSAPQREADVLPLDGTVKLVVSRYLHLHTDLYYTTEVEWQDEDDPEAGGDRAPTATGIGASSRISRRPDGQTMLSYGLHQERRMRSGELHYLDHPVLGLLIKVTPHKPEA